MNKKDGNVPPVVESFVFMIKSVTLAGPLGARALIGQTRKTKENFSTVAVFPL